MCISCFSEQRKPIQPAPHPPTGDSLGGQLKGGVGLAPGAPRSESGLGEAGAKPTSALAARASPAGGWGVVKVLGFAYKAAASLRGCGLPQEDVPDGVRRLLRCLALRMTVSGVHTAVSPPISRRPNTLEQVARTQAVPTRSQGREGCRLEGRLSRSSSPSSGSYRSCCLRPSQAWEPPEERRGPCRVKAGPGRCSRPVCVHGPPAPRPASLLVPGHAAAVTRGSAFPSLGGVTAVFSAATRPSSRPFGPGHPVYKRGSAGDRAGPCVPPVGIPSSCFRAALGGGPEATPAGPPRGFPPSGRG